MRAVLGSSSYAADSFVHTPQRPWGIVADRHEPLSQLAHVPPADPDAMAARHRRL